MSKEENEIEITPEMIEAGVEEISCRYLDIRDAAPGASAEAIKSAYLAMVALSPSSHRVS